ncbi:maleylpyruvate isomerase family mycothiol-dependent enzyme [Nucisporomicrobium flavum]|uniref:maleylpyruvate isomerase family mycothiol-dependent enzyme n=1 Tax=Nucisporomicrobium flavum TaxID=2785915 RepID=UPI0018F338EE|nr:maleylpyruvate isomerase family mycothiol-dependent enzyme [Nucisporomicrobium flavum]
MSDERVRAAVVAERTDMVNVLAGLRPEQWDAPTLCEGWRVREVVAHTTQPFRVPMWRVVLELARARGNVNRMADRSARRDAARLTADQLLQQLRDNVAHPWTPPGGGAAGALSHDVIHHLDITVALGVGRVVPPERLGLVLEGLRPRNVAFFGAELGGVRLAATDLDWSYGSGELVRGRAQDLLLAICGRRLPAGHLEGPAAGRFSR